ncbi:DEAD/DEAH box helicase family protein [Kribbella sp. NBC_01245]|uniref:DEAD/DEAH box helicase n=1 Tax=Kribbella sp. NBC_01245 TaxID=2903578 RepID=UPI002E2D55C9|nr:type ISP restriction/modification enzyme [Kribbella sp. NBC_01245]
MVTIHEVLEQLRATALDERDKGDKFERLVASYLRSDPEWTARFSEVWLWSQWPGRQGRPDTGIDLVAANRDRDDYTAIQCKFYDPSHKVAKADIDSFVASSGRVEFSDRYIFDTAADWSDNAKHALQGLAVPVQRIDIGYLSEARVDWSQFSWTTPEILVPTGPKVLRPHQQRALDDVRRGYVEHDRGKLVMACGTGKTFTSLRIAEELVGVGGSVLFLVPSIQLLSQSLREWMAEASLDIRPFAVCSDVRVGRRVNSDDADMSVIDLTEPATTNAAALLARMTSGRHATDRMKVVFATYQSIDVVAQAQQDGLDAFDLIICDEAHRTTGVTLAGTDESHFVRVHDNDYLKAAKRLYMTATPRVFGEEVRRKALDAEAVLADMGDASTYGPELHRLGFGDAVEADLLTDYKVLVLAVDESYVAENFQGAMAHGGEIALGDAAKLIGCWNGLSKHYGSAGTAIADKAPMRMAVAFAKDIKASKIAASSFPTLIDRALQDEAANGAVRNQLRVEAAHVDGTMGIHERNTHLAWLRDKTPDDVCRVLTNARCLSEGVDVPALDAVLFLTPRGSQVDVVQSVGRVMRKAPGKELGYIILPIVVPSGVSPEEALRDNERYKVVWQVLQALRSHDDRFHAMINQIELNKNKTNRLVIDDVTPRPEAERPHESPSSESDQSSQLTLDYGFEGFRDAMYARIVQKVGERRYWETWARDVSDIAQAHITRIQGLLADPESPPAREFEAFLAGLQGNLNESISHNEAVEMLAQHLVTRPVFEALFEGYDFTAHNPVAQTMELMLRSLDEHNLGAENDKLERFYASVRRRVEGVRDADGKQRVIVELYDKFFATAFKKTVDRLGIVYTPIEIVDFILRSADAVLRQEFGQGLGDEGVHILDGFTGTGTFVVRLLQSGLISPHDLARKYAHELHANEMLLLAYYIAAVNIETTYAALAIDDGEEPGSYKPFPGLVLTDTFQSYEDGDRDDLHIFPENNQRISRQRDLPITVIVGNPPYSVGQASANDDNANTVYPTIDAAIRETYAAKSATSSIRGLYDSYVRAIKWASLRVGDRGVIAYVTNGGFLNSNSADGMRKSLHEEFAAIHIFNLRGNRRNAGAEGRPIFEAFAKGSGGSIAGIAIVVLVKDTARPGPAELHYAQVGDFTTAQEKVAEIVEARSILGTGAVRITPDEHGDWLDQRREEFGGFLPLHAKDGVSVFAVTSKGLTTNRDAWVYNSSAAELTASVDRLVSTYQGALADGLSERDVPRDPRLISWSRRLLARFSQGQPISADSSSHRIACYRPFQLQHVYFSAALNEDRRRLPSAFPTADHDNYGFLLTGVSSHYEFSVIATDRLPDLHLLDTGQFFPRWVWEPLPAQEDTLDLAFDTDEEGGVGGYRRVDNITDEALAKFRQSYPDQSVTKDDVYFYCYGLLHSPVYRKTYAADLKKLLPRIPLVRDFRGFVRAGRELSNLHLGYESVTPYPLGGLDALEQRDGDDYRYYRVEKMRPGAPSAEQKAAGEKADRSTIVYNDHITLDGIPEDTHRYRLGPRTALEWVLERYQVRTDKNSGIVNDANQWSTEVADPRYIIDLVGRVVTVSVETMKIIDALPDLEIVEP